ncbi:hypothetical protein [Leeuwenhoekiella aestuarii]|uniref:Uncharacterized protein n=1 Tax=Leeuwenhoekiella aestuarii TaxID=2249426 RepID=A0A4Q0NX54_9FLAO|nr:hypothetical protein [Leeuwenhoekiella aestuarii]RXG16564.1 hypothetical protein DSM04_102142 [Leeuwenhoekiella aestuarii]
MNPSEVENFFNESRSNEDKLDYLKKRFRYGPMESKKDYENLKTEIEGCELKRHMLCRDFKSRIPSLEDFELQELWEYFGYLSFDKDSNLGTLVYNKSLKEEIDRVLNKCLEMDKD